MSRLRPSRLHAFVAGCVAGAALTAGVLGEPATASGGTTAAPHVAGAEARPVPTRPVPSAAAFASATGCPPSTGLPLYASPVPVAPRTVALTFDDGPSPSTTPKILDVLRRNRVRATFFVVGEKAAAYPALLRRVVAEGHLVGNHTYTHPMPGRGGAFDQLPAARIASELDRTTQVVVAATGRRPCLVRAPGGQDRGAAFRRAVTARRLTVVNWTYDARDWAAPSAWSPWWQGYVVRGATGPAAHPVVLLHDGPFDRTNTAAALQRVITYYRERGYVFTDPRGRRI